MGLDTANVASALCSRSPARREDGVKVSACLRPGIERAAELALKNADWNPRALEPGAIRDLIRVCREGCRP
jgi:hypothetical protein